MNLITNEMIRLLRGLAHISNERPSTFLSNSFRSRIRSTVFSARCKTISDTHRIGLREPVGEEDDKVHGTVGAHSIISMQITDLERKMPTLDTMKKLFDGIPYDELPVAHIKATKNNTIINVTDNQNQVLLYTSARIEGFKNARKKSQLAGQTTGTAAGQKLLRRGVRTIRILVKGLGPGRMASAKGLAGAGVNIISITDRTPIPELGPRPKKIRRL